MATTKPDSTPSPPSAETEDAEPFRASFGEDLRQVLDLGTWRSGDDLAQEYPRIAAEVRDALAQEDAVQRRVRTEVFPLLRDPAAPFSGVFAASEAVLRQVHRGLLFNGGVEACDATVQVHDTLPLTVYQIGVSLVSYRGDRGTWHQRLFRRDLRTKSGDLVQEALNELLRRRADRAARNHGTPGDTQGELARKAVMDYGERITLLQRSRAVWRMGHGHPITYELLTGADMLELMLKGTGVMRALIEDHRRFVFVASEPRERLLQTIAQALPPMHYALVGTADQRVASWFHQKRFTLETDADLSWDGEPIAATEWIPRFIDRVASQVVIGLYRASKWAPAQLFYAHRDYAHLAAHIVLADSMLQEQRGFPLLIDLAHHVCASVFSGSLRHMTETAYAAAGAPWRYFSERTTRND